MYVDIGQKGAIQSRLGALINMHELVMYFWCYSEPVY